MLIATHLTSNQIQTFISVKCTWLICLQNGDYFVRGPVFWKTQWKFLWWKKEPFGYLHIFYSSEHCVSDSLINFQYQILIVHTSSWLSVPFTKFHHKLHFPCIRFSACQMRSNKSRGIGVWNRLITVQPSPNKQEKRHTAVVLPTGHSVTKMLERDKDDE